MMENGREYFDHGFLEQGGSNFETKGHYCPLIMGIGKTEVVLGLSEGEMSSCQKPALRSNLEKVLAA